MRLKVKYKRDWSEGDRFISDKVEIVDLDHPDDGLTGLMVQSIKFEISAEDMVPHLTLKVIPDEIEIECDGEVIETERVKLGHEYHLQDPSEVFVRRDKRVTNPVQGCQNDQSAT